MVVVVIQIPQGKSKDGAFLHLIFSVVKPWETEPLFLLNGFG